jgi:FkbM family methyltransferase
MDAKEQDIWEERRIMEVSGEIAAMCFGGAWKRYVFVDCGFNVCRVMGRFLKYLPPQFRFYGFDILRELEPIARQMERDHPDRIASLEFAAISDTDGTIPFFEVNEWGPNFKGGSSTMNSYLQEKRGGIIPQPTRALDFSGWVSRKFDAEDFVAVKMDIEGAEYPVLEKMLADGSIDAVKIMLIEFHWMCFDPEYRDWYRVRHEVLLNRLRARPNVRIVDWH